MSRSYRPLENETGADLSESNLRKTLDTTLLCEDALGGAPAEILYDLMKAAVLSRTKNRSFTPKSL